MRRNFGKISKTLLLMIVAIIFSVLYYLDSALAAGSTLTVSPTDQSMMLVPGETYRSSIKVSNPVDADRNLEYSVSVGSFTQYKDKDGKDDYENADTNTRTNYNQIMDWIVIEKETGEVMPNNTDIVPFRIEVPSDAPAGGQYATILVTNTTGANRNKEESGNSASIQNIVQFGSIIYAEVAGETRQTADITENNIPSFLTVGQLEATSMVKNTGNVHTNAEYTLQVWPLFSEEEICTNEEEPAKNVVLPETERYHAEKCSLPAIGLFRARQTVKIFGEESIVEKTVIVCPLWLIFIIVFVVIALIVWIIIRAKSRKKA